MYWIGHTGVQKVDEKMLQAVIATTSAFGAYLLLTADPVTISGEILQAVGGVTYGALVWYLIVRHLPNVQERSDRLLSENNKYQRERDAAVNAALAKLHDDLHELIIEVRKKDGREN